MEKRTYIIKKASIPVAVQRITWSFESNRSRLIVETMDNELNLQAKERVNLNALKRIENPHHETPLRLYSINDGCKTAFPTIISEEMVVFGNHVSTFFLPLFYVPGKDNRLFAQDTSELIPIFAKLMKTGSKSGLEYKTIMPEISYRYYDTGGILTEMYTKKYHIEVTDESY